MPTISSQDPWSQAAEIVSLIRSGRAQTRPELVDATGLGRNIINPRLQLVADLGLAEQAGPGPSRGGRAAALWEFRGGSGHILIATIGVRHLRVALADLSGQTIDRRMIDWDQSHLPEPTAERIAVEMDDLLAAAGVDRPWGITIGTPAPVDVVTGQSLDPIESIADAPRMPTDFDARRWFSARFGAPTWTESVANLAAIGAAAAGAASDFVFVRLGIGIGASLVSAGRVHRGAHFLAGMLAHLTIRDDPDRPCMCGRNGCVDTYASGWALLKDANRAVAEGRSTFLGNIATQRALDLEDIAEGSRQGDPVCIELVVRAAEAIGRGLGILITLFDPAEIIIGGFSMVRDALFHTVVDRSMRTASLPAAANQVTLRQGDPDDSEAIRGAAELATQALLSPTYLAEWGPLGSPLDAPGILDRAEQT